MRPNSKNLALRDPALAVLMGAIVGSDFGGEYGDDSDYGDDYGGEFDFGDEYGDEYGYGDYNPHFGAAVPGMLQQAARQVAIARPVAPPPMVAARMWAGHRKAQARTQSRLALIEPNRNSKVKIERYSFSINQALVLGAALPIAASGQPDTNIRPQRVTMNAPSPGFALVAEIKVANVSVTVGGTEDAFNYGANGVGQSLDMPTLSPANRATVLGTYTGFVPPGFVGGAAYLFCISFKGPASIVA